MKRRQFVPGLFVAALLFTGLLACHSEPGRWVFLLVAGPYITMNLAVSICIASRNNWKYLLLLPVVFSILHLSYGAGFLAGLVRFINRWGDKESRVPE
jgi:hypothetical protein